MKTYFYLFVTLSLLTVSSCQTKKNKQQHEEKITHNEAPVIKTEKIKMVVDSTVYGKIMIDDMGMSTFSIQPNGTDTTLTLCRENSKGSGKIFGPVKDNSQWAITVREKGTNDEALGIAINLTELAHFFSKFSISNGLVVIDNDDTIRIKSMSDNTLVYKSLKNHSTVKIHRKK